MANRIDYPRRVELARAPTPLVPLLRAGKTLGVELYCKRDDLTGVELSGNKVRKLEFLLAEALTVGADTVITGGGEQSNHCRATALAATRVGLRSVLLLRTEDPARPPASTGNILLDRLAGAEIVWITQEEWGRRTEMFEREAERVRSRGGKPYVIPEGGSNAVGAWGYVRATAELAAELAALEPRPTTLIYACGSGGTGAGLVLGAHMVDLPARIVGVNVCDDRAYFVRAIGDICRDFAARYAGAPHISSGDIDILDGYVGLGYARSSQDELITLRDLAQKEALLLDPVYTGKAYHALTRELARDRRAFGERVVFLHTGGLFGLFPIAEQLAPLL
jgi:D-cysteine desulfhydrase